MKTTTLVAISLVVVTAVAAADAHKYALADLKALVKDGSFQEALQHLGDVAPSERTADWQDVAAQTALGMVGLGKDPLEKLAVMIQFEEQYPVVMKNAKYSALRADQGPKGFDACFQIDGATDECMKYAIKFVDDAAGNGKLALAIAKAARRNMNAYGAVPLFQRAVTADKSACKDEDLSLAVMAALGLPDEYDNAKIGRDLVAACWSDLRKPIVAELAKADSAYTKKNACAVAAVLKDGEGARLCRE